jgi:preprotein translocase subunit SecE
MSNRAVRRHPSKRAKEGKGAKAAVSPASRPGPGRAAPRREAGAGSATLRNWRPRFFMDIFNELRKVSWPSREEISHLTVVVVVVTLILGAILGAIDIGFGWLVDNTLLR